MSATRRVQSAMKSALRTVDIDKVEPKRGYGYWGRYYYYHDYDQADGDADSANKES